MPSGFASHSRKLWEVLVTAGPGFTLLPEPAVLRYLSLLADACHIRHTGQSKPIVSGQGAVLHQLGLILEPRSADPTCALPPPPLSLHRLPPPPAARPSRGFGALSRPLGRLQGPGAVAETGAGSALRFCWEAARAARRNRDGCRCVGSCIQMHINSIHVYGYLCL